MLNLYDKTDIGLVRKTNQDAVKTGYFSENAVWMVVCDGMGGANGGNVASQLAVEKISEQIAAFDWQHATETTVKNLMISAIYSANVTVFDLAEEEKELMGMGTTVVAAVVLNGVAHIAHAGDSRAYYISSGTMQQLTTDHSMVQELVNSGELTLQEAQSHPRKNIITRALGVESGINIDYRECEMEENSILLLCTDGLTNYVPDETILKIALNTPFTDLAEQLIDAAKEGGGGDNITVAVLNN